MSLSITPVSLDDPTVAPLTAASVSEMAGLYGGRHGSGATPRAHEFNPPEGVFGARPPRRRTGRLRGISRFDSSTGEIRRMYASPAARGQGVAQALLAELLSGARALGYGRVRLETGNAQLPAIRLYERAGFEQIPCWGPYATDERSLCFELAL